jgi:hypothetical protein
VGKFIPHAGSTGRHPFSGLGLALSLIGLMIALWRREISLLVLYESAVAVDGPRNERDECLTLQMELAHNKYQ